jgi:hypothetical protein
MTEEEWMKCVEPERIIKWLEERVESPKFRLFMVACCRRWPHLLVDPRSVRALEVAELHAVRTTSRSDLQQANKKANAAVRKIRGAEGVGAAYFLALAASVATTTYLPARGAYESAWFAQSAAGCRITERAVQSALLREIFGNPFRPVTFDPAWRTDTVLALARQMYESREFSAMPILADALQDAGCDNDDVLNHCRDANANHVRGCWVVDLALEKS